MTSPLSQPRGTATCATSWSSRSERSPKTSVRASSAAVSSPLGIPPYSGTEVTLAGDTAVTRSDVQDAARLLHGRVRRTPLLPAGELSRRVGASVLLKAENLQLTGSFKPRGALNATLRLPPPALAAGVVAASA